MNIKILHLKEGARKATGTTVIPVGDVDLAYRLKEENPDWILAGERGGKILPGFDVGNSPSQLMTLDCKGKTVVHTTSAGTQGIANALGATEVLGGSLVTAKAIADYIRKSGTDDVSLVCMGLAAKSETEEDTLCTNYIKALLEGNSINMPTEIDRLRYTSGAKFFDPAQAEVFPREDFEMCTQLDKFDFVLKLKKSPDGLSFMEKIQM